jgi:hypothetical protein
VNITAADIIKASMRKLGLLAKSEVPSNDEMQDSLQALNMMIDEWGAQKLMATANITENFPLVAGQQSYTIGVGGNFNTTKPIDIYSAYYLDNQNIKYPLSIVTREEFFSYQDSQIVSAPPLSLFYDVGATQQASQLGTIYLYYSPDATSPYTLYIDSQKQFTEFATLTTAVTFPASYYKALVYNLAVEIAPEYGVTISPVVEMLATESKETVESQNSRPMLSGLDLPKSKGGSFNWISGDPN